MTLFIIDYFRKKVIPLFITLKLNSQYTEKSRKIKQIKKKKCKLCIDNFFFFFFYRLLFHFCDSSDYPTKIALY